MLTIKILGPGCSNCKRLELLTRQVVDQMGVSAEIIKVIEYPEIMAYAIMSTPGLVISERVVSAGRIFGSCRPAVEWSNAGEGIINQVDGMVT